MSSTKRVRGAVPIWAWGLSVVGHGALVGVFGFFALRAFDAKEEEARAAARGNGDIAIELPGVAEGSLRSDVVRDPVGALPRPGGDRVARVDTRTVGHGGSGASPTHAIHLEDRAEPNRYSPDLLSNLDRDQLQRLRSAMQRTAWEDRRATTNPMELTFLASGKFERQERRPISASNPSRGADQAAQAALAGGAFGGKDPEPRESGAAVGSSARGAKDDSPGRGIDDGAAGSDHRTGARVATGRPDVVKGPVTIPATVVDRPNDTVDSAQQVATPDPSLVHASMAGGALGQGSGGTVGGGAPGAGGAAGIGSHPRPLGVGDAAWFDLETDDPALMPYFRGIKRKIEPLWVNAFPKSAIMELKQGIVILQFTIESDGSVRVSWPPVRPSGIDEFDRNCADAIRRAAPFGPIPASLGKTRLVIRAPFVADNPIVK